MPSVLTEADKETVKRTVPKPANKIHAVAVARLYIAYPNKQKWANTGLQGAAVLANDLVGNTYWVKMVDISGANRGVIWDQEIYEPFYYNQDRTFFHSFELEECLAGLSFVSEKEAKQFKKKMDEREKNASKETRNTPFQGAGQVTNASNNTTTNKSHSRFGLGSLLHGNQRHSSAPSTPPPPPQSIVPPTSYVPPPQRSPNRDRASSLDAVDPSWRGLLDELLEMGITEDQIEQNQDFIKSYLEQRNAGGEHSSINGGGDKPPSPPSAPPPGRLASIEPQSTGSSTISRRGPAPAPPQPRRSRQENSTLSLSSTRRSPSPPEHKEPTPPRSQFQFKAPPPFADAGKFAHVTALNISRKKEPPSVSNPGPPPPPRPPKTPLDEVEEGKPKFGVPPPFHSERTPSSAPPPPPSRGPPAPPTTRQRETSLSHSVPPAGAAPPLPPKQASGPQPSSGPPPPPPARNNAGQLPPPLPSAPRPPSSNAPPPPLLPPSSSAPPPPPLPSGGPPLHLLPHPCHPLVGLRLHLCRLVVAQVLLLHYRKALVTEGTC